MKLFQTSFTAGEISPLLQTRVDLARYSTSVRYLMNFIVLPEGGIARRPGFEKIGTALDQSGNTKLVPFRYNLEDTVMIEMGDSQARMWAGGQVKATITTPYAASELYDLRYTQSGNVIFFAHQNHPIQMLTRESMDMWTLEELEIENMPTLGGSGKSDETQTVTADNIGGGFWDIGYSGGAFADLAAGDIFSLDLPFGGKIENTVPAREQDHKSVPIIVKGTWEFNTAGKNWAGKVYIEKSFDNGKTWFLVKSFEKWREDNGQNTIMSGVETEDDVLYRVRVDMALNDDAALNYTFIANAFIKTLEFKVLTNSGLVIHAEMITDTNGVNYDPNPGTSVPAQAIDWASGAWSPQNGYPGAIAFYQDRLVLAGSKKEPQTVWMSKIGDYKDFGVSDPLRDDDGITITLAGNDSEKIHSLLAMTDLLAFTASGEWKISGAGENGAISPKAVVAHQQTTIGSRNIQPLAVNNRIIMVQTHGTEVHALGYNLDIDGYSGSEISILSSHLFEWKTSENAAPEGRDIVAMAYQQVPDSLLWFVLADGSMVTCTYQAEHEVIGWARQSSGKAKTVACIPGDRRSELWAVIDRGDTKEIDVLASRTDELVFTDPGAAYESSVELLRINYDDNKNGSSFPAKKLIPRVSIYTVRSKEAWVAQGSNDARNKRRKITWNWSPHVSESNIQVDSGFERDATLQIWTEGAEPLTILAIAPYVTGGA
jgi:hypothetical protein